MSQRPPSVPVRETSRSPPDAHSLERGLSGERRRELLSLMVVFLVVGVCSLRVGAVLEWAWQGRGIGYSVVLAVVGQANFDLVIILPAGLVLGWVALFALDRTKRAQRYMVLVAVVLIVGSVVFVHDRWVEYVDWVGNWPLLLAGAVLGLVAGAVPQLPRSRRSREFPVAAFGLFFVAAVFSVVGYFDVYLFATEPINPSTTGVLPEPGTGPGAVVDAVVTVGFILSMGTFVLYNDRLDVVVLSGNEGLGMKVLTGLFDVTQDGSSDPKTSASRAAENKLSGHAPARVGEAFLRARGKIASGSRPAPPEKRVEFVYLPPVAFSRWIRISAVPLQLDQLTAGEVRTLSERAAYQGPATRITGWLLKPLDRVLTRIGAAETRLPVGELQRADVLILVASTEDIRGYTTETTPSIADLEPPEYTSRFVELCRAVSEDTKRIIVLTDAEWALDVYEAEQREADVKLTDEGFRIFAKSTLLEMEDSDAIIVPVSREIAAQSDESRLLAGIDELRREIDRAR